MGEPLEGARASGPAAIRAVRGAIAVAEDSREAIIAATRRLVTEMLRQNGLQPEDLIFAFFTSTRDLVSEFPAVGARQAGLAAVPLMCAQEIPVPGSLPRCIRALFVVSWPANPGSDAVRHVYLDEARVLRPDLT